MSTLASTAIPSEKHDTGDTGEREHRLERCENTECEVEVQDQTHIGHQTGDPAIINHHQDHQQEYRHHEGDESHLDGLGAEARSDHVVADHFHLGRHLSGLEHVGEVIGLLGSEVTGDLGASARDLLVDVRERIDIVVEDNGNGAADVVAGDGSPFLSAAVIHLHIDHVALHVVVVGRCGGDGILLRSCLTLRATSSPVGYGLVLTVGFLHNISLLVGDGEFRRLHTSREE